MKENNNNKTILLMPCQRRQ